jgi:hypothetical protein
MAEIDAFKDPVGVDKQTLKNLGIKEDTVSPVRKLAYLQEQLGQLETMFWRARTDVVHAKRLQQSDVLALKNKGLERETAHMNEIEQFYGGMIMVKRMVEQLREEYPELAVED